MKVILFNSPIYNKKVADKEDFLSPLGLGYIATQLKNEGINVKIIDCVNDNLTVDEILNIIDSEKPDTVGINIFSVNFDLVKKIIESCYTKTNFIVGGKSTKFLVDDILKFKTDNNVSVVIGEGEYITIDIIRNCVKEQPKFKKENKVIYEVSGNSIYLPRNISELELDRSFFENRMLVNKYQKVEQAIVTSRECLYNCAFCGGARSLNQDVPVRERDKKSILRELIQIKQMFPETESIRILDDLFLKNRNSILKAISIFGEFDFEWRAMAHIKSLQGSEDLFEMLKNSGCRELEIGIESGNEKIRSLIHKVGSVEEIYNVITKILDSGINVKGYFMYGFPNETITQCNDTYLLALKLYNYSLNSSGKFMTSAFQFRPYHGTELYKLLNQKISYEHNDELDELVGRKQFNFMAGNFSNCTTEEINRFIIETNKLDGELDNVKRNSKV